MHTHRDRPRGCAPVDVHAHRHRERDVRNPRARATSRSPPRDRHTLVLYPSKRANATTTRGDDARARKKRRGVEREREKKNSCSESATKKKEEWSERARRRSWSEPPAATARAACRATAAVRCRRGSRRATDARGRPPNGDGFGGTPKRRPLSRDASCRLTDSSNKIEKKDKKRPSHADWNHHDVAHRLFAKSLRDIDQKSNDYISRTTITTNSSLAVWITDNPK